MPLYEHRIRRRLAPMLGGDRCRLKLAYSLLLTLPGAPVLFYGEEIGMGDDLSLAERNSVRTPVQWADAPHGGFTSGPRQAQLRPVIRGGPCGYEAVNMESQRRDPEPLLNWLECATRTRKACPEFGFGTWSVLDTGDPAVLAHSCQSGGAVLARHHLSDGPRSVAPDLSPDGATHLVELWGDPQHIPVHNHVIRLTLDAYGYRWFRFNEMQE